MEPTQTGIPQMLDKGCIYLVKENKPNESFNYFMDLIKKDVKGLCISRQHPESLKAKFAINDASIVWLTTSIGEDYVNPTNIGILMDFVENFIKKTPNNSVVLLDGIEYLSSYIDFTQLLESLHYMNEVATKNGAIVIIPLTPEAFVHEDKTLLEKDTEIIEAQ